MTEAEIYGRLTEIFHEAFGDESIVLSAGTTAADVEGWDSFKQVEILVDCEERFCIKFSTREIDSLDDVGRLVALIAAKAA